MREEIENKKAKKQRPRKPRLIGNILKEMPELQALLRVFKEENPNINLEVKNIK